LLDAEVFLFTDNTTAEGCFYKGNSPSKLLFHLILRLRVLEMTGRIKLHVIHVSGSRMIAQGTDGLSRGGYGDGVMSGASMLSFVPLHFSALDRMPSLLPWIRTWCPDSTIMPLTPEEWFWEGHGLATDTPGTSSAWHPRPSSRLFSSGPPPRQPHRLQLTNYLCPD
jgi:hypothetical protein